MKSKCVDCGIYEALPGDELCQECRENADEPIGPTVIYKIPWQKYDPENPPEGGRYIVSDGKKWCEGYYFSKEITMLGQYWGVSRTASSGDPVEVVYYAPINLPGEE